MINGVYDLTKLVRESRKRSVPKLGVKRAPTLDEALDSDPLGLGTPLGSGVSQADLSRRKPGNPRPRANLRRMAEQTVAEIMAASESPENDRLRVTPGTLEHAMAQVDGQFPRLSSRDRETVKTYLANKGFSAGQISESDLATVISSVHEKGVGQLRELNRMLGNPSANAAAMARLGPADMGGVRFSNEGPKTAGEFFGQLLQAPSNLLNQIAPKITDLVGQAVPAMLERGPFAISGLGLVPSSLVPKPDVQPLREAFQPGWFEKDPEKVANQAKYINLPQYVLPGWGQVKALADIGAVGGQVIEQGSVNPIKEFVVGQAQPLIDAFNPKLPWEDRVLGGLNVMLLGMGVKHGLDKAAFNRSLSNSKGTKAATSALSMVGSVVPDWDVVGQMPVARELAKKLGVSTKDAVKIIRDTEQHVQAFYRENDAFLRAVKASSKDVGSTAALGAQTSLRGELRPNKPGERLPAVDEAKFEQRLLARKNQPKPDNDPLGLGQVVDIPPAAEAIKYPSNKGEVQEPPVSDDLSNGRQIGSEVEDGNRQQVLDNAKAGESLNVEPPGVKSGAPLPTTAKERVEAAAKRAKARKAATPVEESPIPEPIAPIAEGVRSTGRVRRIGNDDYHFPTLEHEAIYDKAQTEFKRDMRNLKLERIAKKDPDSQRDITLKLAIRQREWNDWQEQFWNETVSIESDRYFNEVFPDLGDKRIYEIAKDDFDVEPRMDARSKQRGGTKLPLGDLKRLGEDLAALAHRAFAKGTKQGGFVAETVKRWGQKFRAMANAAYRYVASSRFGNWVKRHAGSDLERLNAKYPTQRIFDYVPEHLRTGESPEAAQLPVKRVLRKLLLSDSEAAIHAREVLEKKLGRKLEGSELDLWAAFNQQSRLGHKIEDFVLNGIRDADGIAVSRGVNWFLKDMQKNGVDSRDWQSYMRAYRENEIAKRKGRHRNELPPERIAENLATIAHAEASPQAELYKKYRQEWWALSDAHLDLYEQYGLRPAGWAQSMREENAHYFPMDMVGTEEAATMRQINPQAHVSPGKVTPALGGRDYADAFGAMARKIETVIRDGELNQAVMPFLDEVSKHEDLSHLAREVKVKAPQPQESSSSKADPGLLRLFREELEAQGITGKAQDDKIRAILAKREQLLERPAESNSDPEILDDPFETLPELPREGDEPVVTFYDKGVARHFRIDPFVWDALRGGQPKAISKVQQAAKAFADIARGGTTKYNPFFALLFNPMIDLTSATVLHGMNPLRFAQGLRHTLAKVIGQETEAYRRAVDSNVFFNSKGARDFFEQRSRFASMSELEFKKEMAKYNVRGIRSVRDVASGISQAVEEATRLGFFEQQRKSYLKKGMPEREANRRASQDAADLFNFGDASEAGRALANNGVPYANISSQSLNSLAKGYRRNPKAFAFRVGMLITLPALIERQLYKDDREYQSFPEYVRYGAMTFRTGLLWGRPHEGSWVSLRLPSDLAAIGRAMPVLTMDAVEKDKTVGSAVKEELRVASDAFTPSMFPTWLSLFGQSLFFAGSGATSDLRFMNFRGYPASERQSNLARAKSYHKFWVQQADTLLGSLGRYVWKKYDWETYSKNVPPKYRMQRQEPSLFQRFRPQPDPRQLGVSSN